MREKLLDLEPIAGSYFVSNYPPFSCWNEDGAKGFRAALDNEVALNTPLGLYLHVPFCVQRCQYCYYLSYDDRKDDVSAYLAALDKEAALYAELPALRERPVDFCYVGGGTPSLLAPKAIEELFASLRARFDLGSIREITFECAPLSVSRDKLEALRDAGVTRISMGVQQLDDAVLERNGRVHRVKHVERARQLIREAGFDLVNLDLIAGLVDESDESFDRSLERVIQLAPESVTIYQLEIPLNTPLYAELCEGRIEPAGLEWAVKRDRHGRAFERLEKAGYKVRSAYSAVRDVDKHAFQYQDLQYRGADLVGLGVSAFSHVAGVNHQNRASLSEYMARAAAGELPLWRGHSLSREERFVREFILQLKLGGLDRDSFFKRHGMDPGERFASTLRELQRQQLLTLSDGRIECTREGLLRVDRILPLFYLPEHADIRYS